MEEIEFSRWLFEDRLRQGKNVLPDGLNWLCYFAGSSKSHHENSISSIFLESPHQVHMKNVVKSSKHFYGYFNTLETHSGLLRIDSLCTPYRIYLCCYYIGFVKITYIQFLSQLAKLRSPKLLSCSDKWVFVFVVPNYFRISTYVRHVQWEANTFHFYNVGIDCEEFIFLKLFISIFYSMYKFTLESVINF